MKPREFFDAAKKEEMTMSIKRKIPSLVALAIVVAAPAALIQLAFAGRFVQKNIPSVIE
jgi:hypothetical protein